MELALLISDNMDPDSGYLGLTYYAHARFAAGAEQRQPGPGHARQHSDDRAVAPLADEVLFTKAEVMMKKKDYLAADSLFG